MRLLHRSPQKLATVLTFLAGACAGPGAHSPGPSKEVQALTLQLQAVAAYVGEGECGGDLKRLISNARAECRAGSASPAADASPDPGGDKPAAPEADAASTSSEDGNSCGTDQLKGAIKNAEHALYPTAVASGGKRRSPRLSPIVEMINRLRCEVLYLDGESDQPPDPRVERLRELVQLPALPQTHHIILASTLHGEADARHRADVMRHQIEQLGVKTEVIDPSWLYPFELTREQLHRPELLPRKPMETSDLSRAVWVCRTSC